MRIIAGKFRRRRLKSPPSDGTRPTSDRLRETLFNILAPRIEGTRFLDLCAGSGAVGIEALSRGAAHATFVDQSRQMCVLIETNLKTLGIDEGEFEIIAAKVSEFLRKCQNKQVQFFDIMFFDPPYAEGYDAVLNFIAEHTGQLMAPDGIIVVEHHRKNELPAALGTLSRYRVLRQGDSALSFYRIGQ